MLTPCCSFYMLPGSSAYNAERTLHDSFKLRCLHAGHAPVFTPRQFQLIIRISRHWPASMFPADRPFLPFEYRTIILSISSSVIELIFSSTSSGVHIPEQRFRFAYTCSSCCRCFSRQYIVAFHLLLRSFPVRSCHPFSSGPDLFLMRLAIFRFSGFIPAYIMQGGHPNPLSDV